MCLKHVCCSPHPRPSVGCVRWLWAHDHEDICAAFASLGALTTSPQPQFVGQLGKTPLAELLVQVYDRGLEGTLLLQTADKQKSAIWFVRGAPAKARQHDKSITLSQVVAELGLLKGDLAAATQKQAEAEGKLHGAMMMELGLLDQTGLYLALREQLVQQVLALCRLDDTTGFGFYQENFLETWGHEGQWRVKPLRLIWRALTDQLPTARRQAWLAKLAETPLRLRGESPVSRYGLSRAELSLVDLIRAKPSTVRELIDSGVGSPTSIEGVLCALLITRQLDLGFKEDPVGLHEPPETPQSLHPGDGRATRRSVTVPRHSAVPQEWDAGPSRTSTPVRSPSSDSFRGNRTTGTSLLPRTSMTPARTTGVQPIHHAGPPFRGSQAPGSDRNIAPVQADAAHPQNLTPDEAEFAAELQRYLDHPPKNLYECLGLLRGADTSQVRTAFFQLARRWHPDKLSPSLAHFRPTVTRAFSEMGEAHQVLMDDARRVEYDRGLDAVPDEEQEQVAAILRAASAYQRADVLFKKKSYQEALHEAKLAYDQDGTQPDHVALYAWLHTLVFPDQDPHPQIDLLSKVLETSPDHIKTLWYRGQLYKKVQNAAKALRDFKHIVHVKPSHVDAARELRVYQMRRQTDPKAGPSSTKTPGLFGSFRKKT